MHALLIKFITDIQCSISRIVHYIVLLHQAKSAYSGDWIEWFSFAEDSPLHLVLDIIVLEEPDELAQTCLVPLVPVLEG